MDRLEQLQRYSYGYLTQYAVDEDVSVSFDEKRNTTVCSDVNKL